MKKTTQWYMLSNSSYFIFHFPIFLFDLVALVWLLLFVELFIVFRATTHQPVCVNGEILKKHLTKQKQKIVKRVKVGVENHE